jgi:cytidylate kinase
MIVTLDGPAGAGKSSVARALAARLGFRFLDTGAMYRAVAWAAQQRQLDWNDSDGLDLLTRELDIRVTEDQVLLDGRDVTKIIRTMEVTGVIHHVADNPNVRRQLVELQRQVAANGDFVTEGRDQGTIVFPNAECKIFLTASPAERARRRMGDLKNRGEELSMEEVLSRQNTRDQRDRSRAVGALIAADDAIQFDTSNMELDEVVDQLEAIVRERLATPKPESEHA